MKANEIMSKASGALNKIGFGLKKRSPEILVAVGVVGTVVSAVMACLCPGRCKAGQAICSGGGAWDFVHQQHSGIQQYPQETQYGNLSSFGDSYPGL